MIHTLTIETPGSGLHEITAAINTMLRESGAVEGLCTLCIQHTSASLLIQENADPAVRRDLEAWLCRLAPEGDPLYTHTSEGPDDMPSHIKAALTATSLGIPFQNGHLCLGTWQGVFLWEHRRRGSRRRLVVHLS